MERARKTSTVHSKQLRKIFKIMNKYNSSGYSGAKTAYFIFSYSGIIKGIRRNSRKNFMKFRNHANWGRC